MTKELFKPAKKTVSSSLINNEDYQKMYKLSVEQPEIFWREQAEKLEWIKPFAKVKDISFKAPNVSIKWFEDGLINASVNCIDRHLPEKADEIAIIWESDNPSVDTKISYDELYYNVCKLANVYKNLGICKSITNRTPAG